MALDLTQDVPRSPFDTLDGYAWLPRMIDKARAMYAGTLGEYSPYPCPGDKKFLGYFGLDPAPLGELVKRGATDEEIAAHVRAHSKRSPAETGAFLAEMKGPSANLVMRIATWVLRSRARKRIGATRPDIDWGRVDSLAKVLAVEEGHGLPG